jgi:hypothetical protein
MRVRIICNVGHYTKDRVVPHGARKSSFLAGEGLERMPLRPEILKLSGGERDAQ